MKRWLVLVPLLCGVVAYAPAPWSELVWDDVVLVEYQIGAFRSVADAFVPPADVTRWTYAYYRPVVVLMHMLERRLFGLGASGGPHLVNLGLHLAATLFVWLLVRRLLQPRADAAMGALIGATIFAVHPIHAESVSWIAGRSDLVATVLLLPALWFALEWRDRRALPALVLSPLLYLAAVLAKETGILALALVPWLLLLAPAVAVPEPAAGSVVARLRRTGAGAAWAALAAGYAIATLAYLWLRHLADIPPAVVKQFDWAARLAQLMAAAAWYLVKLVAPWPQSALVSLKALPSLVFAIPVVLVAAALTGRALWQWRRDAETMPLLAWGWLWATLALPLWIAVFALNNTPLAERYLYLPSVALALAVGLAWCAAGRRRLPLAALLAVVAVVFAASTLERALVWRNNLVLWTDTVRKSPEVGLAWTNLGFAQLRQGDESHAMESFVNALKDPSYEPKWVSRSHNGLGLILVKRGRLDEAEEHLRTAIDLAPTFAEPYLQMGLLFEARAALREQAGDIAGRDAEVDRAVFYMTSALRRRNNYFAARLALAGSLARDGQRMEREQRAERARLRYQAAAEQLEQLGRIMTEQIPVARHAEALRELSREAGVDEAALRGAVASGLGRLSGAPPAS